MHESNVFAWILVVFGAVTCLPLFFAQSVILINPRGEKAKELLIGKGEEWRNDTHFKSAYGFAISDWLIFAPILITGSIGLIIGTKWGFLLYAIAGGISVYINVFLFFFEKKYVYPKCGPLRYYTYYWGHFVYWGLAAIAYSIFRIISV